MNDKKLTGVELIARERSEQLNKHGRTIEHDLVLNANYELCAAATALLWCPDEISPMDITIAIALPDWDKDILYKMDAKPYKERLIIAGALIAAELDRIAELNF